uniref:Uncharacterized protein n=1 Tax=Candidatus Kentrum sp. LPFa TaxID=2126335 RepID=A0A450WKH7_9GAMM|nr:MAG: hypothetical protein BECKLPF1236B_GA0070989_11182 [Candidatus Kentron sp. LPFa]
MAWKNLKQLGLVDGFLIEHKALTELDEVNALIDWVRIENFLSNIHAKPRGEKSWPPVSGSSAAYSMPCMGRSTFPGGPSGAPWCSRYSASW